ncbi:MAG: hypothetical protein KC912_18950 [Proteobacteria bacterium]|nr:hypothetical protein [Pseudomonadota bacterium]
MQLILFAWLAAASPSQRGLLPSASPIDFAGHASLGGGGANYLTWGMPWVAWSGVSVAVAPSQRFVVQGVLGGSGSSTAGPAGLLALSGRASLVETPSVRLAAFAVASTRVQVARSPQYGHARMVGLAPGMALEAGGDRVLFDMSYAPVEVGYWRDRRENARIEQPWVLQWLPPDVGVSLIGPRGRGRFRFATVPSWSYVEQRWWMTASLLPTLFVNVAAVEVGVTW